MKRTMLILATFFVILHSNLGSDALATVEVESKEEILGYIRVLFSDKKVVKAYQSLVNEGYVWTKEFGNFGSMHDERRDLELFTGQVQIIMQKGGEGRIKMNEKQYKQLTITFTWSRKSGKIVRIDSIDI